MKDFAGLNVDRGSRLQSMDYEANVFARGANPGKN